MSDVSANSLLKSISGKITDLPTLPKVVSEITELTQSNDATADQISSAIAKDQAISTKVLKLVNSSFYGFPGRINTISHAVVILGFNSVKNVALLASVFENLGKDKGRGKFDIEKFWLHSIATGVIAKQISKLTLSQKNEDVFFAGLLHDIGKIVLYNYLADEFVRVETILSSKRCLFIDAEKEALGITHADIGGMLVKQWNLPQYLHDTIFHHHTPLNAETHKSIVYSAYMADIMARGLCIGSGGDTCIPKVEKAVWENLKIDHSVLNTIYQAALPEIDKASSFLKII